MHVISGRASSVCGMWPQICHMKLKYVCSKMFLSCRKCRLSCQIHSSSSLLRIFRFRLGGGPIRLTSPSEGVDDNDDDDDDEEDDEQGCRALEIVGCWTTALNGRPTFPPAVAVSAESDEIDEYDKEDGDWSIEGPNNGPDGGRILSEVACRAASGDGDDDDALGASDGTVAAELLMLVLTSISHLLRLLRLSTTDDTSLGCFWMSFSV